MSCAHFSLAARLILGALLVSKLVAASSAVVAQPRPDAGDAAQGRDSGAQGEAGRSLTDKLKERQGVIDPPAVDPDMAVAPPPTGARTPVLPPSAAPQQPGPSEPPARR